MAELPHLVKVANEFAADGGRVLSISEDLFIPDVDEPAALAAVKRVATQRNVPFPIWILRGDTLDGVNEAFNLPGPVPCTLALDANGKEVDREEGEVDDARLRQMLRRALGKEPPAKK